MKDVAAVRPPSYFSVDEDWLALTDEEILEPDREIVDPHHHLWDRRPDSLYLFPELMADMDSGHRILATVFVQCSSMYRADGPDELASLGEVEFVNGVAAMSASGRYGDARACAGIVGFADLARGDDAGRVLERMAATAPDRFRGIRQMAVWDADPDIVRLPKPPPRDLLLDAQFRRGFAHLGRLGLSFDAFVLHPQLDQVADLADAFPDTTIVLNHFGGFVGVNGYAAHRRQAFAEWRAAMMRLARHPNVMVKLGGIGMHLAGFDFQAQPRPPGSERLAEAWRPFFDTCVTAFGAGRCMFESNFPVDRGVCNYRVVWNAFKRLAASVSEDEKRALFRGTADRTYRLGS